MAYTWKDTWVVLLLTTSLASSTAKLSFGMRPCARSSDDLNTCVTKMASRAVSYVLKEESIRSGNEIGSLLLSRFTFNVYVGQSLLLDFVGREVLWQGLETAVIRNVKIDLDDLTLSFDLNFPTMKMDGTCAVEGRIFDVGIHADGERFPLTVIHSASDGLSSSFTFKFEMKTNISGVFLVPSLTSYSSQLGSATLKMEKLFPPNNSPGQDQLQAVRKAENFGAEIIMKLEHQLLQQMVEYSLFNVTQMNTYNQLFPERLSPEDLRYEPDSAPTLRGGWLPVLTILMAALLQVV